jgi:metal-dependent amidase/aminoacylase/carboxypeptidase family protein
MAKRKTILFRCELDALPIHEINTFEHRSLTNGVSHKCGHDGHMAIFMWFSNKLDRHRPETGKVILLQPAEEDGSGAQKCFQTQNLLHLARLCFALHNLPGYQNQIIVKNDTFTCAVNSIIIKLEGITAHAGEPEGDQPCDGDSVNYYQFNTFILQLTFFKEIACYSYYTMGKKAYGVQEKFIYGKK